MTFRTARIVALSLACAGGGAHAALQFTDWTSANTTTDTAVGSVGAVVVTLTGTAIAPGNVAGTAPFFSAPGSFTPALPQSDALELAALAPSSFTITFSSTVVDPVIHLADLSSNLTFSGATPSLVSGLGATVAGNQVLCDGLVGGSACRGTVKLVGAFNAIGFSAFNAGGGEGFYLQLGFDPLAPVPEPATWALMVAALGLAATRARRPR